MASKDRGLTGGISAAAPSRRTLGADFAALVDHVRENPLIYLAGFIFIVICIIAGLVFGFQRERAERAVASSYAMALDPEEPAARVAELEAVAGGSGRWAAEAQYMLGTQALRANETERAKTALQAVIDQHSDTEYASRATADLAFIAESAGDSAQAAALYKDVRTKWPDSFAAKRAPLGLGRVLEAQGDLPGAIAAYQDQLKALPGSHVATAAQAALDRLAAANPELFPKAEVPTPAAEGLPTTPSLQGEANLPSLRVEPLQ